MKKNVQIMVAVDEMELSDMEVIMEALEELLKDFEYKRVTASVQAYPSVKQPTFE